MCATMGAFALPEAAEHLEKTLVGLARHGRVPQHGAAIAGVIAIRHIGFLEIEAHAHVEKLAQSGVAKGAVACFRQNHADGKCGIYKAVFFENSQNQCGDRLRDREHEMRIFPFDARGMPFGNNPAIARHEEAVGLAAGEKPGNGFIRTGTNGACHEFLVMDALGQRARRIRADPCGRHQFGSIAKRPSAEGLAAPILECCRGARKTVLLFEFVFDCHCDSQFPR